MNLRNTVVAGAVCLSLTGCGEHTPPTPEQHDVTTPADRAEAYLPTWLSPQQNERIAKIAPQLGGVTIAFALPSPSGEVQAPAIEDLRTFKRIIGALPTEASVNLAIGGWGGNDAAHHAILEGFTNGAQNAEKFAKSTEQTIHTLETQIGHTVGGIDIDWEYPTAKDTNGFATLLTTLHHKLPEKHLSIAAPAYDSPDSQGITAALRQPSVRDALDKVHVMTYDQHGPWDDTAGTLAAGDWVKSSIKNWTAIMGAAKVSPGYATYCYEYEGAKRQGYAFTGSKEHAFSELPKSAELIENTTSLTTATHINGNWTSCQSPQAAKALDRRLRQAHPKLGNRFFWDANGLVKQHLSR